MFFAECNACCKCISTLYSRQTQQSAQINQVNGRLDIPWGNMINKWIRSLPTFGLMLQSTNIESISVIAPEVVPCIQLTNNSMNEFIYYMYSSNKWIHILNEFNMHKYNNESTYSNDKKGNWQWIHEHTHSSYLRKINDSHKCKTWILVLILFISKSYQWIHHIHHLIKRSIIWLGVCACNGLGGLFRLHSSGI